jgi:D-alanyl-D-alanine carboxypeptidase
VKTKVKIVPNPNEKWGYKWLNKNKMLYMYDGADGVKTGYTRIAGRCLISSATRDGRQIAVVTLNDPNDWADHKKLLDYGFNQFAEEEIIEKGESFGSEALRAAHSFRYPLRADETEKVEKKISFYQPDSISYRLGEIGRVDIYLAGELIGSVPLNDPQAVAGSEKEHQAFRGKKANTGYASVLQTVLKQLFSVISGN